MLLNHFFYSIIYGILLLQSSSFCMQNDENFEVEIEMKEFTASQKPTLLSLIQEILKDNPQKCMQCKKQIEESDVSFYIFNCHDVPNLQDQGCFVCFKKEHEHLNISQLFDIYHFHDACYIKLCKKIEEGTCAQCTQKAVESKNIKNFKNKFDKKKYCACCTTLGAGIACCCNGFKDCLYSQTCREIGWCECFLAILEALFSSSD